MISDPLRSMAASPDSLAPACEAGVFLFDIDGTLMKSGGAGGIAFRRAFHLWSGVDPTHAQVPMAGRTDREILRLTLEAVGLPAPDPRARRELVRIYLRMLAEELSVPNRAQLCPGVSELLHELARRPCAIGLVTGNIEPGARLKLRAAGIDDKFAFGAYGSDHEDRDRLVPIALGRLRKRHSVEIPRERVWVIGDTLRDVQCARAAGVNVLAVGTGFEDQAALADSAPGRYVEDLSDTPAVLRLLGAFQEL